MKPIHLNITLLLLIILGLTSCLEKKFEPIVSEEEVERHEELLAQQGIYPGNFKVAIQPGASKPENGGMRNGLVFYVKS